MSSTTSIVSKISQFLTGDIIFLLALFAVLFVLTMYLGKGRLVSVILAFYAATILYKSFPYMEKLLVATGEKPLLFNKLGVFLVFLVLIYLAINKFISHYAEYGPGEGALRTGGFVLAMLIVLIVFSYTTISLDPLHNFGSQIDAIFGTEARLFWWSLAPLVLLGFL
ncbi:MAG: hypothetical protein EXS47_00165 [Candidatus Zambryskibacteria bacterium]|nr:hypothetical protein [Candidatus Zambryskibacteria bacterium]